MKRFFYILCILFISSHTILSQNQNSIQKEFLDEVTYKINHGWWHLLRENFEEENKYLSFISIFQKTTDKGIFYEPYRVVNVIGNVLEFKNIVNGSGKKVTIWINNTSGKIINYSDNASINPILLNGFNRLSESEEYNFIKLPTSKYLYAEYLNDYLDYYNNSNSLASEAVTFKQINFDPLEIEFEYCEKILGINVCGTKKHKISYGAVLSGKDIPGNESEFIEKYFTNIADVTAFINDFGETEYLPNEYVLTAVIVDDLERKLTFFREGLIPFDYGINPGDIRFEQPIAVKSVGGFLYVLDAGTVPSIKVFKVEHSTTGDYSVNHLGTFTNDNVPGLNLSNPSDISGFPGSVNTSFNSILVSYGEGGKGI